MADQDMDQEPHAQRRYFISYSGVRLPLNFVNEIDETDTENRNTYFCAFYDGKGTMVGCEKRVYGEIEFEHRYSYHPNGRLQRARITLGDEAPQYIDYPEE